MWKVGGAEDIGKVGGAEDVNKVGEAWGHGQGG